MFARFLICALGIVLWAHAGWAASFQVKADTGVVLLWKASNNYWSAIKDSAEVGGADSLYVDDKYSARLLLGKGCTVLIRGESRLCLKNGDATTLLYFDIGQIFLKRDQSSEQTPLKIVARGCSITPVGTAAAVKLTKNGEPSVAVLAGKMRMESEKGEYMVVGPGKFGTFNPEAGIFKQGPIPPEAATALENWSGVKLESPEPPAKSSSDSAKSPKADSAKTSVSLTQPVVAPQSTAAASAPSPQTPLPAKETEKKNPESRQAGSPGISWEISAGSVTVGGVQWTRLAISPDIPLWKFGVGLDLELFLDQNGDFSKKSWEFDKDNWYTSLSRKIKYFRFGRENDPLFVKVGGLSSVTLGYGFIVDRLDNMLHYPDQKLLGLQVYLSNVGPLGVSLQTMTPDAIEFKNNGGIAAGRLAIIPLKMSGIPLLKDLSLGGTYSIDLNQFAPARDWTFGNISDKNHNGITDWDYAYHQVHTADDSQSIQNLMFRGIIDPATTLYPKPDTTYRDSVRKYALLGGDVGVPLIKTIALGLDLYGQAGVVADSGLFHHPRGWGFGAPGIRLTTGPLLAQVEYRHVNGKFVPGYFGPFYLDQRLSRYPVPMANSDSIPGNNLDGVFGKLGVNIFNLLVITGSYQYMSGSNSALDQRMEATGQLGDAILKRIPKISKAECYFYKTNINRTVVVYDTLTGAPTLVKGKEVFDQFLEMTPDLYWGYRVGFEITKGASIICDMRYGYRWNESYKIAPFNQMIVQTAVTF
jgi:hypothetical protein